MQESSIIDFNEIDLTPYFQELRKSWILLLVIPSLVLLAGIIAQRYVLEEEYEAESLIAVSSPNFNLEFDARFTTLENETLINRSLPELAVSDDILQMLYDALKSELPSDIQTPFALGGHLEAVPGNNTSLIRLTATHTDPELAALIANQWANIFIRSTNQLLGTDPNSSLEFINDELDRAKIDLEFAENELLKFSQNDNSSIISVNLKENIQNLELNLRKKNSIELILDDLSTFQKEINLGASTSNDSNIESILLFFFKVKAFNLDFESLEISTDNIEEVSQNELLSDLDALQRVLQEQVETVDLAIGQIGPRILELEEELSVLEIERRRLEDSANISRETFLTLSRKVEEQEITIGIHGMVRLASNASTPVESTGNFFIVLLSCFLAFLGAFSFLIVKVWWQQQTTESIIANNNT